MIIDKKEYIICDDNIIRKQVGKKWNPACPNSLFQPLVEKLQDEGQLSSKDKTLYGQCILSLAEIVLNNKHFKFQNADIKNECRSEALECALVSTPVYFDRTRGKAYSYVFRCMYTAMIHVLERYNERNEMFSSLDELCPKLI